LKLLGDVLLDFSFLDDPEFLLLEVVFGVFVLDIEGLLS
jgi:hypothetical protein